jgi:hypothetical protein
MNGQSQAPNTNPGRQPRVPTKQAYLGHQGCLDPVEKKIPLSPGNGAPSFVGILNGISQLSVQNSGSLKKFGYIN